MNPDFSRFESIFRAIEESAAIQAQFFSDLNTRTDTNRDPDSEPQIISLSLVENSLKSVAESINRLTEIQSALFDMEKEKLADEARQRENEKVRGPEDTETPDIQPQVQDKGMFEQFFSKLFEDLSEFSFGRLLTVAAMAPFIFNFAKGFVLSITDETVELTAAGVTGIAAAFRTGFMPILNTIRSSFTNILTMVKNSFASFTSSFAGLSDTTKKIANSVKNIKSAFMAGFEGTRAIVRNVDGTFRSLNVFDDIMRSIGSGFKNIVNFTSRIGSYLSSFANTARSAAGSIANFISNIPGVGVIKTLLGKLSLPITLLLGVVEAVRDFMASEGTMIERFGAGLGGFLASVVGAPIDLLKNVVSWVLSKFGFENASQALTEFSVSDTIKSLTNGIFGVVSDSIEWIRQQLADPTEAISNLWSSALGGYKSFLDIIYYPVDKAIQWISGIFGWEAGENFSMTDTIWNAVGSAAEWVKSLFTNPIEALSSLWETALGGYKSLLDLMFYPVDKAVQWVSNMFKWEAGENFSLTDTIWDSVKSAIGWIKSLYTNPTEALSSLWSTLLDGANSLSDLLFYPVDKAIQWVSGIFGWEEGEQDFSLSSLIDETIINIKNFFTELFDFLPSIEDIKSSLTSMLPNWMKPESVQVQRERIIQEISKQKEMIASGDERDWTLKSRDVIVKELEGQLAALPQYNKGSEGFEDFGVGTPAMLHGKEAIVPLNTPAGSFLEKFFTTDWQPNLENIMRATVPTPYTDIQPLSMRDVKQSFIMKAAETNAINKDRAQAAITNIMPNVVSSRPITNNNSSTTIINNVSPARSLDDPSMLK